MKVKHNVILILVSSKWLFPYSGGSSRSQLFILSFLLGVPSSNYHGYPSKSLQVFTLCFHFLFLFILLLPEFLLGGSTWWIHQGVNSFSKFSSTFFSKEFKLSSSWYPECNSFFHIIGGGIMSFLIIWVHVSWFTSY